MLIWPAAMLTMAAGMKKGEILRGPPCSRLVCSRSMISKPPMPEPMKTPTRSAFSGVICEARLRHGLLRGGKGKVDEAPHLARFFLVHKFERVEVLDLGGEGDREASGVEALDGPHAAGAGQKLPPNLGSGVAHTADQPQAGDDDSGGVRVA